jgi:hypothetical protein
MSRQLDLRALKRFPKKLQRRQRVFFATVDTEVFSRKRGQILLIEIRRILQLRSCERAPILLYLPVGPHKIANNPYDCEKGAANSPGSFSLECQLPR